MLAPCAAPGIDAYTAPAMRRSGAPLRRRYWLYAGVLAVPMAQLGHVVSYSARYGSGAVAVQSSGVHAYFPDFLKVGTGLLAAAVLAALLIMGAGRLVLGRTLGYERRPRIPIFDLVVACVCFQLDVYIVQEVVEAFVSGQAPTLQLLATVVTFGLVGQGPLALLAALALYLLSTRLEPILEELRYALDRPMPDAPLLAVASLPRQPFDSRRLPQVARAACATRGPPAVH